MSEIDWSKAPEGATHGRYVEGHTPDFYKMVGDKFCYWDEDKERWMSSHRHVHDAGMVASPCTWTGAGLPPVGTVCELHISNDNWQKCEVIAMDEQDGEPVSVVRYGAGYYGATAKDVRLCRTPEQIAAELREKEIEEMLKGTPWPGSDIGRRVCEHLHSQGYRKQEQPK